MRYLNTSDVIANNLLIKNVLVIQNYSMYDKETGKYRLLSDGNLNLTLHRIYNAVKERPDLKFTITRPSDSQIDINDLDQFDKFLKFLRLDNNIDIKSQTLPYSTNAYRNREAFVGLDVSKFDKKFDIVLSDFENLDTENTETGILYTFNISKYIDLDRPYIDEFFNDQLRSIKSKNAIGCAVLNEKQVTNMLSEYKRNHIDSDKVFIYVDQQVISYDLLMKQYLYFIDQMKFKAATKIHNYLEDLQMSQSRVIFFPFRLSDPCYKFSELIDKLKQENSLITVIVTNPNNTDLSQFSSDKIRIFDIKRFISEDNVPGRSLYYFMMKMCNQYSIQIPVFEDETEILHQALIDLQVLTNTVCFIDIEEYRLNSLPRKSVYLNNRFN